MLIRAKQQIRLSRRQPADVPLSAGHSLYYAPSHEKAGLVDNLHRNVMERTGALALRPEITLSYYFLPAASHGSMLEQASDTSADSARIICIPLCAGWCDVDAEASAYQVLPCVVAHATWQDRQGVGRRRCSPFQPGYRHVLTIFITYCAYKVSPGCFLVYHYSGAPTRGAAVTVCRLGHAHRLHPPDI